jgi:hypothetical protein
MYAMNLTMTKMKCVTNDVDITWLVWHIGKGDESNDWIQGLVANLHVCVFYRYA